MHPQKTNLKRKIIQMSIFNMFKGQNSAVIQWENPQLDSLWYKIPSSKDEVINASKLIVASGQGCVLVYEGKIVNIITEEGTFNLTTDNHPFVTALNNLRQNFESEHKLQIFFFKTTQIIGQMWETSSPIKWVDPEYKLPMQVVFNGDFSYQIQAPQHFFTNIVGSNHEVKTDDLRTIIVERLLGKLATTIHQNTYSFVNIDSQLGEMSQQLKRELNAIFTPMGVSLTDFRVVGSKVDYQTVQLIGRIAEASSDAKATNQAEPSYAGLEKVRTTQDIVHNEGGAGMQFGMGTELTKQVNVMPMMKEEKTKDSTYFIQQIRELKQLADKEIISFADFEQKKNDLLKLMQNESF